MPLLAAVADLDPPQVLFERDRAAAVGDERGQRSHEVPSSLDERGRGRAVRAPLARALAAFPKIKIVRARAAERVPVLGLGAAVARALKRKCFRAAFAGRLARHDLVLHSADYVEIAVLSIFDNNR